MAYFVFAFDNPNDNNPKIGFTLIPDTGELISDTWAMPATMKNATSSSSLASLLPTSGSAWTRNGVTMYYDSTKFRWAVSAGGNSWFFYDCPDGDGNTVEQCLKGTANLTYSGGTGVGKCAYNFGCEGMLDNGFQYATGNRIEWNELPFRVCGFTENYLPSIYKGTDNNDVDIITYRVWANMSVLGNLSGVYFYVDIEDAHVDSLVADLNYFECTYKSSPTLSRWDEDIVNADPNLSGDEGNQHIDVECYLPHVCTIYVSGNEFDSYKSVSRCFISMLKNRYWKNGVDNRNTYGLVNRDLLSFHENVANSNLNSITLLDFPSTDSVYVRLKESKRRICYNTQSTLVWLESSDMWSDSTDSITYLPSSSRSVSGTGTYTRSYVCDGFVRNPVKTLSGTHLSSEYYGIEEYSMKANAWTVSESASAIPVSFYASGTTVIDQTQLTVNFVVGDGIRSKEGLDKDGAVVYHTDSVQDYDGSTALLYSGPTLNPSEFISGHTDVQIQASVPSIRKMTGLQTVSVNFTLTGSDAGLYAVKSPVLYSVYVEPKNVTVNASVTDKYYDGTTRADLVIDSVFGIIHGDDVMVAGYRYDGNESSTNAVVFPSRDVGTYNLQVKYVLAGIDAGNYVIAYGGDNPYVGLTGRIKSFTVTTNVVGVSYKAQN